jgi:hypothetical protein
MGREKRWVVALLLILCGAGCDKSGGASTSSASGSDDDPALMGYTVLASTLTGHAVFIQKTDATTPQAAIIAGLRDLTHILDGKPTVNGAFSDVQQNHRGGATFSGNLNNQAIKGTIICGIGEKGAAITILYDRADAPASDWATLMAALPTDTQTQDQSFGDGAGTISLPQGWKIVNSSNIGSVVVQGPNQQVVNLGIGLEVAPPGGMLANYENQLQAQGKPPTALIAPFSGPVDALKALLPQLSLMSQASGGPAMKLDEIMQSTDVQAQLPNGQAARIYCSSTQTKNGQDTKFRSWIQMECYPVLNGSWGVLFNEAGGPDATFDGDLPTMLAIAKSWKLNDAVVAQHTQQNIAASNQRFAAFQQSMKEKDDAFQSYMKSVQNTQLIRERSNADFDEVIRGYRTVEDTETGGRTSVDLGNVNEIVNDLNKSDPGRYVQIPLRDEEFPLPQAGQ